MGNFRNMSRNKNKRRNEDIDGQEVIKEENSSESTSERQKNGEDAASKGKAGDDTPKEEEEAEASKDAGEDLAKAELESKLTAASDKLAKTEDAYVRLMAEFDTFRRRTAQEKLDMVATAAEDTIKGLLVVLDDCERAMKALAESDDAAVAKEGTELIYNKLMAYLKGRGLSPIDAMGELFDTDEHEAVAQVPVEDREKKGRVFDVIQTGYKLNGKVIRFAKVVVGI